MAILNELGAELVTIEWLVLANMPGSCRVTEDGTPTCRNHVMVSDKPRKAEPIFVFRKR
jgi:hypothetical protein